MRGSRRSVCALLLLLLLLGCKRSDMYELNAKKANSPVQQWLKDLSGRFSKEGMQMARDAQTISP